MVIDETANIEEAARNTRISKTSDYGSGCSADGNLVVEASIYDPFLEQLQKEGGYLVSAEKKSPSKPSCGMPRGIARATRSPGPPRRWQRLLDSKFRQARRS
jgi:hypothetical protein